MAEKVTMKQEIFCQEYIDTIGNGAVSALKAFDIENKQILDIRENERTDAQKILADNAYNTASTMGVEYLRKPNIIKRIDEILDERGFTDETVKKEHFKLIIGSKDEVRMRAIDSYYKLKGKNQPDKVKHSGNVSVTGFDIEKNDSKNKANNKTGGDVEETPRQGS